MDETTRSTGEGGDDASSRFGKAREFVNDTVKNQYNRVREHVDDVDFGAMTDQVRSYVRSNPGKALLVSVGVGFLVGLLLRRSDDEEED